MQTNDSPDTSMTTTWETLKAVVRGTFIATSSRNNKEKKAKRSELEDQITSLVQVGKRIGARAILRQLNNARKQPKTLDYEKAEYALLRTKQKYYKRGNKVGRLLDCKLRARVLKSRIDAIKNTTGTILHSDEEVAHTFERYYATLYTAEDAVPHDIDAYPHYAGLTKLPPFEASKLETEIKVEEVITAISRLQLGKAPALDGLTPHFYKLFCSLIAPLLTRFYNSFIQTGKLTDSMREAVITVIPKPGKDPSQCPSYRPISLLNVDAKLFTGILAARLNRHMLGLVDPDQTGFIPERGYSDNTKRILHLIDKPSRAQKPAILVSINAEKAFGQVHWPFIHKALDHIGFGPKFQRWIWCGYTDQKPCVRVNWITSRLFPVARWTRQGFPLSPPATRPLHGMPCRKIRHNPIIKGSLWEAQNINLLSMRDVFASLSDPQSSLLALLTEFDHFRKVARF